MMDNIEWKRYWLMVGLHPTMIPALKNALHQDADTGLLKWTNNGSNGVKAGDFAGSVVNKETVVKYRLRKINASSVVWLLHNDVLPPNGVVKYRDGNPRNLRIENLYLMGETPTNQGEA